MIETLLQDKFARTIKDLRVSVTDRCNFHCFYCIPDEDIVWQRKQSLLTYDEIVLVSEIAVGLGVEKLRLTGGEPLARKHLERQSAHVPVLHSRSQQPRASPAGGNARAACSVYDRHRAQKESGPPHQRA
jgi:cyclic pyranopterin phosphate synthase